MTRAKGHEAFGQSVCGGRADEADPKHFPGWLLGICLQTARRPLS
jgi:hypothetical protein